MKRILLITESLGSGGAERQICGLAAMLTAKGYECRLITYSDQHFYEEYLLKNKVDYEYVPSLLKKETRIIKLIKYFKQYRPTTIISYLPSVNKSCCLAAMFYKCRLIVSERNNNTSVTRADKILFNLYRIADFVVPNSYTQGEFIRKNFPFLNKKIVPIINFVDVNRFIPKEKNKRDCGTLHFVTMARFAPQKNCILFLEVVRKVKEMGLNVHFDWFGNKNFNRVYYDKIESIYKTLDIDDYLTLHDATQDIVEKYQDADVFILPSLFEGYPNVIIEAMCCELPVICSNVFENRYIVKEGENGFLFNPVNVDEIVASIRKMTELSPEQRKIIGKANRSVCLNRNSQAIFIEKYESLI